MMNREQILANKKEYREKNKDKIKEYDKLYRERNKEQIKEYHKTYYNQNKDKISEKIQCECGGVYRRDSKSRHLKTKMHTKFINGIEPKPAAEKYCICERCNKMVDKHSEGMSRHMKRWPCVKAGMEGNPGRKEFFEWILNNKDNLLKDYEKHIKNAEAYFEKREEIEINVAREKFIKSVENSEYHVVYVKTLDPYDYEDDKDFEYDKENGENVEFHLFHHGLIESFVLYRWWFNQKEFSRKIVSMYYRRGFNEE